MRVGAFDSEEIAHVEGEVNPIRDLQIIHEELRCVAGPDARAREGRAKRVRPCLLAAC